MGPIGIAAIVFGVGWLLVRRVAGQRVELRSLLILPTVLTIIGVTEIQSLGQAGVDAIGLTLAGVVLSIVIGAIRGATVGFGAREGQLWMRYRRSTIALWLVNIAAKAVLIPIGALIGGGAVALGEQSMMLAIGLGILAESGVVMLRGQAKARELGVELVWSVDRDGTVRTTPQNPVRVGADTTWAS